MIREYCYKVDFRADAGGDLPHVGLEGLQNLTDAVAGPDVKFQRMELEAELR